MRENKRLRLVGALKSPTQLFPAGADFFAEIDSATDGGLGQKKCKKRSFLCDRMLATIGCVKRPKYKYIEEIFDFRRKYENHLFYVREP